MKFLEQLQVNKKPIETKECTTDELLAMERVVTNKFGPKVRSLTNILALFTLLNLGCITQKHFHKDKDSNKIENSSKDKKGKEEIKTKYTLQEADSFKAYNNSFMERVKYFKNIEGLDLAEQIKKIANESPHSFLQYAADCEGVTGLNLPEEIKKVAQSDPHDFIYFAKYYKEIKGLNLAEEIQKATQNNPGSFLFNVKDFGDIKGLNLSEEIKKASERDPGAFLSATKDFRNIQGLKLAEEISKAATIAPKEFFVNIWDFKDIQGLNLAEEVQKASKKDPKEFFGNLWSLRDIKGLDLSEEVKVAAERLPALFFDYIESMKNIEGLDLAQQIKQVAEIAPGAFIENIEDMKDIQGLNLAEEIKKATEKLNYPDYFLSRAKFMKDIPGLDLAEEIKKAAESSPTDFLAYVSGMKDIPGLNLLEEVQKAAAHDPSMFLYALSNIQFFKDIPGLNLVEEIKKAAGAKHGPGAFLYSVQFIKDVPGLDLAEEIKKAAESAPGDFLTYVSDMKDIPGLNLLEEVTKAAQISPGDFLTNIPSMKDIQGLNLVEEVTKAAKQDPRNFLESVKGMKDIQGLNLAEEVTKAAKRDPLAFLTYISGMKDIPGLNIAQEIKKAAERESGTFFENIKSMQDIQGLNLSEEIVTISLGHPKSFFYNFYEIKNVIPESELLEILEKTAELDPEGVYRSSSDTLLNNIKNPQRESIRILKNIKDVRVAVLLNDMVKHNLSEADALEIINNKSELLKALTKIKSESDHIGRLSVESKLRGVCLQVIREINDLHEEKDTSIRFKSVNNLEPNEIYTAMVYGEEEVFTSSFNGMFDRLLVKMKDGGMTGKELLEQVGQNKFRTFVKECVGFNRLNDFLNTMDQGSKKVLLSNLVSGIEVGKDKLAQATALADIFSMVTDKEILKVLQDKVKSEYERVASTDREGKILYGILSGMFSENAITNKSWFKEISNKYKLENLSELKSKDLFNKDGSNIQQYFFYNDPDGKASFESFLNQYKDQSNWHIEKKENYVLITSTKGDKKMEIYANYPESENEGPKSIDSILSKKDIQTLVVVHRGHSFHAMKTIERIPSSAKIVSLGSCGGYNNIEEVLKRAPKSHILSTKGTGTMLVNDPLLKDLNNKILAGQNIVWSKFWEENEKKLGTNPNFQNYISPNKNIGVLFLKTYYKALEQ